MPSKVKENHLSCIGRKTTTIFHSHLTGKLVIEWIAVLAQQWKRNPFNWNCSLRKVHVHWALTPT